MTPSLGEGEAWPDGWPSATRAPSPPWGLDLDVVAGLGDHLAVFRRAKADLGLDLDDHLRERLDDLVVHVEVLEPGAHLAGRRAHDVVLRSAGGADAGRDRAAHEVGDPAAILAASRDLVVVDHRFGRRILGPARLHLRVL